jgi:tetratricopeptide (TPR) repeat protein
LDSNMDDDAKALFDEALKRDPKASERIDVVWADVYTDRGRRLVDDGKNDEAIGLFDLAIQHYPKYGDAIQHYPKYGDVSEYDRAIEFDPKHAAFYSQRGLTYHSKKDYDAAVAAAYFGRGKAHLNKTKLDAAITDFSNAISLNPGQYEVYWPRADAYTSKHDYDSAITDYIAAIALLPSDPGPLTGRGWSYSRKGDFERAIADDTEAIRINKDVQIYPYWNRGDVYRSMHDFDHAISDFTKAIELNDHIAQSWAYRGNAYLKKGDYALALADFDRAIALDSRLVYAYRNRALVYLDMEDFDRAIADTSEGILIDPTFPFLYANRCGMFLLKAELQAAIADCDKAIQNDDDEQKQLAYRNRGRAFLYSGSPDKARADFAESTRIAPTDAYSALWLYIGNRRAGLDTQVSDLISQVDTNKWPAPIFRFYSGVITFGDLQSAAEDSDELERPEQECDTYFFAGELSLLRTEKDEAVKLLQIAANTCPKYSFGWQGGRLELKMLGLQP